MDDLLWMIFPFDTGLPFPKDAKQGICEIGEKFPVLRGSRNVEVEYTCRGGELLIQLSREDLELLLDYDEFKKLCEEVWGG
jgi:hypothetical protein